MAESGQTGGAGWKEAAEMASVPLYGTGLAEEVREGWPEGAGEGPGKEVLQAVGTAMERYLGEQGLGRGEVPGEYVERLLYRALRSVGEDGAAGRRAKWAFPGEKEKPAVDPDYWPGPVPLETWRLFEERIVRPMRGRTADGRKMWILDFHCWKRPEEGWMELTLLPGIRAILERLSWGWDPDGAGVLGLRGLAGGETDAGVEAESIRRFCAEVLARVGKERGWGMVPDVVRLDPPAARGKGRRRG